MNLLNCITLPTGLTTSAGRANTMQHHGAQPISHVLHRHLEVNSHKPKSPRVKYICLETNIFVIQGIATFSFLNFVGSLGVSAVQHPSQLIPAQF